MSTSCEGLMAFIGYECREIQRNTLEVDTPFLFADGEPIAFYIEKKGGQTTISDNADTLMHLAGIGIDITDRKKWKGVRSIVTAFGLDLNESGLIIGNSNDGEESQLITKYMSAMLSVADLEREHFGLTIEQAKYIDEVEEILRVSDRTAELIKNPIVTGHSGKSHTFDFDFYERLIDAARPHGGRTGSILRKAADIKNAGNNKKINVVMDDREDPERAKAETDILSTMVGVISFSALSQTAYRGKAHIQQLCDLAWPEPAWIGQDGKVIGETL